MKNRRSETIAGSRRLLLLAVSSVIALIPELLVAQNTALDSTRIESPRFGQKAAGSSEVILYRAHGYPLNGYLTEIDSDSLVLQSSTQEHRIGLGELTSVDIRGNEKYRYAIRGYGAVLGVYLGNLAFNQAHGQPAAYYAGPDANAMGVLLINSAFAAGGLLLGHVFGAAAASSETVVIPGDPDQRAVALERLREISYRKPHRTFLEFSAHGGYVFTRNRDRAKEIFTRAGASEKAGHFNMLRRLELAFPLSRKFRIGLAAFWLSEPNVWGYINEWYLGQSYRSTAYYLMGKYNVARTEYTSPNTEWLVGGGIGFANVKCWVASQRWSPEHILIERSIKKHLLSAYASCELDIFFTNYLSLGVAADYVLGPTYSLGGIPEVGLDSQRISVSSPSIGFMFKIHM